MQDLRARDARALSSLLPMHALTPSRALSCTRSSRRNVRARNIIRAPLLHFLPSGLQAIIVLFLRLVQWIGGRGGGGGGGGQGGGGRYVCKEEQEEGREKKKKRAWCMLMRSPRTCVFRTLAPAPRPTSIWPLQL